MASRPWLKAFGKPSDVCCPLDRVSRSAGPQQSCDDAPGRVRDDGTSGRTFTGFVDTNDAPSTPSARRTQPHACRYDQPTWRAPSTTSASPYLTQPGRKRTQPRLFRETLPRVEEGVARPDPNAVQSWPAVPHLGRPMSTVDACFGTTCETLQTQASARVPGSDLGGHFPRQGQLV